MIRALGLFLAVCGLCAAAGNLQLFHSPPGGSEQPVTGFFDLSSVAVTDITSTRFRIRNTGDLSVSLTMLRIAGTGFSISGAPSLPHIVAPGTNVDFTVSFRAPNFGSYSANLQINTTSIVIRAAGLAGAAVFHEGVALASGATIDLGRAERGDATSGWIELRNTTATPVTISNMTISGTAFVFGNGNPGARTLQPGEIVRLELQFRPPSSGIFRETLTVDGRAFQLTGTGMEPSIPRPSVVIENPAIRSGEQGRVSIRLASTSKASAKGQIRIELRPAGQMRDNDAAAQFTNGSRVVDFEIREGDTSGPILTFQSGTTYGTLVFTVQAGGFTEQASATIAPEPVRLDSTSAARTSIGLEVVLTGFDNTRTASDISFTFYGKNGQALAGMPIRASLGADFARWWEASNLGGIFSLRAAFPVAGDASGIGSVEVEIVNQSGNARTSRLTF